MSANNSFEHSINYDSISSLDNTIGSEKNEKSYKIEILSVRIEYDSKLPSWKTITHPYGFFQLNEVLDLNTVNWYSEKIKSDITIDLDGVIFILPHRHIITGDDDIFNFNGKCFNTIDIIFGQEVTYWRYSTKLDSGEIYVQRGQTILEIGNCPCCIGEQYKRVIDVLKKRYEVNN